MPDFRDNTPRARYSSPASVCCGDDRYAADYFCIFCALAGFDRRAALTENSSRPGTIVSGGVWSRPKSHPISDNSRTKSAAGLQWTVLSSWVAAIISCLLVFSVPVQAEGLIITDAWVPAIEAGRDVALLVTIRNETSAPDALTRVSCPVANFYEKHTVDRGEGPPAMRPISSIPVPASSTVVLKHDAYHVMLLQIRQPLAVGEQFKCTLVFQKAGSIEAEVEVR